MGSGEILIFVLILLPVVVAIIALLDLLKQPDNFNKIIWSIIILILPLFGALIYFTKGKRTG